MSSWIRPAFLDSEYYVGDVRGGYFLAGVPQELVEEYNAFFSDINDMVGGVRVEINKQYAIQIVNMTSGKYQAQLYKKSDVEGGVALSSSNMLYVTQGYDTEEQAIQDAESHYHTLNLSK